MRLNRHVAAVDAVVTTVYQLTMALVVLCLTAFAGGHREAEGSHAQ